MIDWSNEFVAALVATGAVLLIAAAVAWRRVIRDSPNLPVWSFLRREGITRDDAADLVSGQAVKQAELSCAACGSRQECLERLAAGAGAVPPANCPNARLFDDFGIGVDQSRK